MFNHWENNDLQTVIFLLGALIAYTYFVQEEVNW